MVRSGRGRVVKALDSKSNGVSPRRFESCRLRNILISLSAFKRVWLSVLWIFKALRESTRDMRQWSPVRSPTNILKLFLIQIKSKFLGWFHFTTVAMNLSFWDNMRQYHFLSTRRWKLCVLDRWRMYKVSDGAPYSRQQGSPSTTQHCRLAVERCINQNLKRLCTEFSLWSHG